MYIETRVYTTLTCRIPRVAAPAEFDGGVHLAVYYASVLGKTVRRGKRAAEQIIIIIVVVIIYYLFCLRRIDSLPRVQRLEEHKRRRVLNIRSCTRVHRYTGITLYTA